MAVQQTEGVEVRGAPGTVEMATMEMTMTTTRMRTKDLKMALVRELCECTQEMNDQIANEVIRLTKNVFQQEDDKGAAVHVDNLHASRLKD